MRFEILQKRSCRSATKQLLPVVLTHALTLRHTTNPVNYAYYYSISMTLKYVLECVHKIGPLLLHI
jgi:hypothetical protein